MPSLTNRLWKQSGQLYIIFFTFLLLSACSPSGPAGLPENPTQNPVTIPPATSIQPSPSPTSEAVQPSPTPGRSQPITPLSRYSISATLDYDTRRLDVEQTLLYVNHTGEELTSLLLLVEPNRYPGGFTLEALSGEGGSLLSGYTLEGARLDVPLPGVLPVGESAEVHLSYNLLLPNQNAPYGWTERQLNLGDWYPYVPPYLPGEGWLVRDDSPQGEHLAYEPADFQVDLLLAGQQDASGRPLVVAASALPSSRGDRMEYRLEAARNFAFSVSPLYQVQQASAGPVTVMGYSFPNHPSADLPALQESARALQFFGELFGPYPHASLSIVEADFLDGMEYDGLIFLSHAFYDFYTGDAKNNLTIIAAHEVAHQWFYALVGNDQALEPWLDEALATYSELLYYEASYPELAGWWRENRIAFHNPQGWVNATIYDYPDFYPYRNAVYLRGAMFLDEVRARLGDQAFKEFLRDYLNRFSYRQASAEDFFMVLSETSDQDLSGLIASYFSGR